MIFSCKNLKKYYIDKMIFKDISFSLETNDKVGLVGDNGSGKSTLMNILSGVDKDFEGELGILKSAKVGYLKQRIEIDEKSTVYEACLTVFENLKKREIEIKAMEEDLKNEKENSEELNKKLEQYSKLLDKFTSEGGYEYNSWIKGILRNLGFTDEDYNIQIRELSGGQKSRLMLSMTLLEKPDILLLDEPTNHLDIQAIEFMEKFLSDYKGILIIVSHDRYFLDRIVNKVFHLENNTIDIYNCNFEKYRQRRLERLEIRKREYLNQQNYISKQEEIIKRFANYGGSRYSKQSQSRIKLLEKIKRVEDVAADKKVIKLDFNLKNISGKDVLHAENLGFSYGDKKIFNDINFNIYRGEKVGLIGENGIGKTTLFNIISGKLKNNEGIINIGPSVNVAYFDQEQDDLDLNKTVIDEFWDEYPNLNYFEVREYLAKFNFINDDIFKLIEMLSGGEKSRLAFLKLMLNKSNFLLLDEPTNHLDIDSREILEQACLSYQGTILFISHDRFFLNKVADKILTLEKNQIKEYYGNYNYYKMKEDELKVTSQKTVINKTKQDEEKKKERLSRNALKEKKKDLLELENKISELEKEKNMIELELTQSKVYDDLKMVMELNERLKEIDIVLDNSYSMWIELDV